MKKTITLAVILLFAFAVKGFSQITTYPYVQTGDLPIGWTVYQSIPLWSLETAVSNPAGIANDAAIVCNNFAYAPGPEGLIVSPSFNFSALTKPVLNFYVAYKSYATENDSLQVLVSLDNGATFINTPTPYRKAFNSVPSLATGASQTTSYNPSSPSQWRHETIDLSAYAGNSNIYIAFRGVCAYGNNLWIDNFIVNDADGYCQTSVTSAGTYNCSEAAVTFNTIGMLPDPLKVTQNDNPTGGVLSVTKYTNQRPPTNASPEILPNSTALNAGGTVTDPNVIYEDYWFTVTYTGNDLNGYANYNIKIDVSYFSDISKLYIMKRADMTASWECLNTSLAGSYLQASGLTTFCDFALAGDSNSQALPVELASFTAAVSGRHVNLNWSTAYEINNSGFDIERSADNSSWARIGYAEGNGNSNNTNSYSFTDINLNSGRYHYRLKQTDFNGNFEYFNLENEVNIGIPSEFSLSQNYPNPFNPSTSISFELPYDSRVSLKVFDMSGKEVAELVNEIQPAGYHTYKFNASALSSGVYFYRISADGNGKSFNATKKMMLVK